MTQVVSLDSLPDLPQVAVLRRAVEHLAADTNVRAVWLGGSFAVGSADRFSDVDLRIAVNTSHLSQWRALDCTSIFGQDRLGGIFLPFGDEAFLHHLVLEDGTIFDFFVQTTERQNPEHAIKVLSCRDEAFAGLLEDFERPISAQMPLAQPQTLLELIIEFWMNSHKHRKVMARGLPMLAAIGVQLERMTLMRLWYALLSGRDAGGRPSIHGLSAATGEIEHHMGKGAMGIFGMPLRDEQEVCRAIEADRDEVARVGRLLATREKFDYPEMLEKKVKKGWDEMRNEMER